MKNCHCLCPIHRRVGGDFDCEIEAAVVLTMTTKLLGEVPVPMCGPCGQWWLDNRSRRAAVNA